MDAGRIDGASAFRLRVEAQWGLIACGTDAIPYALRMLTSPDAEIREDAGGILGQLGKSDEVVEGVLAALEGETDDQARDSLVIAIGELGDPRGIPMLAKLIRSPETDGDTRFTAVQSLGRLARRRFDKQEDPARAAIRWLDGQGH